MRYFYLLVLFVFASSCAHNTIRLVKTKARPEVIVENEQHAVQRDHNNSSNSKESIAMVESKAIDNPQIVPTDLSQEDGATTPANHYNENQPQVDDTIARPSDAVIYDIAKRAEKDAELSKSLFLSSIILLIIPIFSVLSLTTFVIGCVYLSRADKAPYITQQGQRDSEKARKGLLVYIIFIALIIALIAALLLIFL